VNPQSAIRNPQSRPRGYTLVELLIVMVIIVILIATALPLVRRVMDNDRVRESSRQFSAYLNMAKTRAMQTGRPCALLLELEAPLGVVDPIWDPMLPKPAVVRQCTKLYLAEVPPSFAGSTQTSKGRIRPSLTALAPMPDGTGSPVYEFYPLYLYTDPMTMAQDYRPDTTELAYLYSLIPAGDQFLIRFNHMGTWYICQRGKTGNPYPYDDPDRFVYTKRTILGSTTPEPPGLNDYSPNTTPPSPPGNAGYSYQIMRTPQPVGDPLELTGGTCIDLCYSGMGLYGNTSRLEFDPVTDLDGHNFELPRVALGIVFTPSGGVSALYGDGIGPQAASGTLHFLVGRVAKMDAPYGDTDGDTVPNMFEIEHSNLADATSLWVSIGRLNGNVTTSENMPNTAWTDYTVSPGAKNYLSNARSIATGRQQMGGQ
jgi:prepilin-type N-terminal cleavage/methylation domain-containing protein